MHYIILPLCVNTFFVVSVKKWLKLVYIYGSYCKLKLGYHFFGTLCNVCTFDPAVVIHGDMF